MRRFTLQFEKISLAAAVAYVLVLAVGLGEATLLAQENDSENDAEWLSHFRCKQCGHLLESDLPFGVFTEEEIEKFRSVPVNSKLSTKTPPNLKALGPGNQSLTIVVDFKSSAQPNTTDVFGNTVSSFDLSTYGFNSSQEAQVLDAIFAEVIEDCFTELLGTVANQNDMALDFNIIRGEIGTAPAGVGEFYFIQVGSIVSGPQNGALGVAAFIRDANGNNPNSGLVECGDVIGSVFTNTLQQLTNITPADALSSGDLELTTNAITGTLAHEIGHMVSLSHINVANSVQPTPGRVPIMGTGAIDLLNQFRLTDSEFSLSGFNAQDNNAAVFQIQQMVDAVGLRPIGQPSNDDFNGTMNVNGNDVSSTVFGLNIGATTQADEQQLGSTGSTVWWFVQAPADGTMIVDTLGSDFDTQLHVFTGFELGFENLIPVDNNDDTFGLLSQVEFPVDAGECYELRVGGFGGPGFASEGGIQLNVNFNAASGPPNDAFNDRITITNPNTQILSDNFDATTETDEIQLQSTGSTVWWTYDAVVDGTFTIDTFGSDFDTQLQVFTGPSGIQNLSIVASNDDAVGLQSEVVFEVVAGTQYEIRVGGFGSPERGAQGNIVLNLELDGANTPANDDWVNSTFIAGPDFNISANNLNATLQSDEQQTASTGSTVWWFFDSDVDGSITIDTFESSFDTQLHIFEFPVSGQFVDLVPLVNNDDAPGGGLQSEVVFDVLAGQRYEVRVGGFSTNQGDIVLNGVFTPSSGCPNGNQIGDVNGDGNIDLLDVQPFVELLTSGQIVCEGDINQDGNVDLLDVQPFIELLSG